MANLSSLILPVKNPSTGEVTNQEFDLPGGSEQPFDLGIEDGVYGYYQTDGTFVPFKTQADIDRAVAAAKVGTAVSGDVLIGKTFTNSTTSGVNGSMTNNGAVSLSLNKTNPSRTIPEGYHNGEGTASVDLETKTVAAGISEQTVNPSTGKLISQIIVGAVSAKKTLSQSDTGSNVDMSGAYRYVDASAVYNKGKSDGMASIYAVVGLTTQTFKNKTVTVTKNGTTVTTATFNSSGSCNVGLPEAGTYTFTVTY